MSCRLTLSGNTLSTLDQLSIFFRALCANHLWMVWNALYFNYLELSHAATWSIIMWIGTCFLIRCVSLLGFIDFFFISSKMLLSAHLLSSIATYDNRIPAGRNLVTGILINFTDYSHVVPYCFRLVSVRSSHLPFKMHSVGFSAFKSPLYWRSQANRGYSPVGANRWRLERS